MFYANRRRGVLYYLILFIFLSVFLFQDSVYSSVDLLGITLNNDPRMLAVNPVTNRALITHWLYNSASVVDLNSVQTITELPTGKLPKGVAIDTVTNTAVIASQADRSITLIDLSTNKTIAIVNIGRIPSNIAVNSPTHIAAVTSVIDLYVSFVDLTTQKVVAKTKVGINGGDIAIDPVRNTALVLNKLNKTLTIIDMRTYKVSDSIHLDKMPQSIDVNPETNTALITNYLDSSVTLIDLLNRRSFIIPVVRYPLDTAFNTIDNRAVVLCDREKELLLLDLNTNKIISTYALPRHPQSVAVNSIRNIAIVADDEEDGLTIIPLPISPSLPKITITSPQDNAQLSSSMVNISGTVENSTNVTVNGIAATVSGNTFSAKLTLSAGQTTIAAIATDKYGRTACDSIIVEIMLSGKITGTVTNAATGWLLPLAIVSITDSTGTTQTITTILSGTFTAEIPAGVYTVTVIKPWYLPYSFIGSVSAGETSVTNVPLTPSPPTISNITVTDIAENSAKINWTTDQLTEGRVEYGKTNAYGATASDSIEGTAHSITLASLSPATNYHFRVIATSANGTSIASNDGTFKTIGHIDITINSPAAGASINSNSVIVTGSIANAANIETGVTVNGVAAALINNQFAINNVPLTEGQNTITVTATDTNGTTATKSIIVNAANIVNYIKLSAYPESGAAPMEVTLRINGTFSIANPVITSTGP
jgi:DNA-binding beta-propeller fold protein YncE